MKVSVLVLLILFPCLLLTVTRTVSLDGTEQYTSIQTAIDACSNGDIVEVYPGEYFEHLNTNGRSITIQSRYHITQSETTINNTIIHSTPQYSCLKVNTQESVTINGFTLMNNYPVDFNYNFNTLAGGAGGIYVRDNSSINILNCKITNCIGWSAGGIYFRGNDFYMSNTQVFSNYGYNTVGGVYISGSYADSVVFDNINFNSVYNNTSWSTMDMLLASLNEPVQVSLHTFSIILTEPDGFFVRCYDNNNITFSTQNAYFNIINQDVYVSPNGNDLNSGLSPLEPLKTIVYAVKLIASDSLNPKTIHLMP